MTNSLSSLQWRARFLTPTLPALSILAVAWCCLILAGRCFLTSDMQYTFLVWNLFLAAVPLFFSMRLTKGQAWWKFVALAAAWLLFFPNAPYVLTDFVHLHRKSRPEVPIWYDIGLLANFGVVSLMLGIFSLRQVHKGLEARIRANWAAALVTGFALLAGFGVYLGRFLRWNSWDLATRPLTLLSDVFDRFIHPFDHPRTWVFTLMYGGTLAILYWIAVFCCRRETSTTDGSDGHG